MPVLVYSSGALAPIQNSQLVDEQLRKAHNYRNVLVKLERDRREAMHASLSNRPELQAAESAHQTAMQLLQEKMAAVKSSRKATRSKSETEEMRAAVKIARAQLQESKKALYAARATARTANKQVSLEIEAANKQKLLEARAAASETSLYWGTYLKIEYANDLMRQAMPLHDGAELNLPRFQHWTGEGKVAVQIQNGIPAADLYKGVDRRVRISRTASWCSCQRRPINQRPPLCNHRKLHLVSIRIGSTPQRDPIWATWPIIIRRPFPPGALVTWVIAKRVRIATAFKWLISFTLRVPEVEPVPATVGGAVAVDLGWRVIGESLRAAYWMDNHGVKGELRLPLRQQRSALSQMQKAEELRSGRDLDFNTARDKLNAAIKGLGDGAPQWLRDATISLWQWRSAHRLVKLIEDWRRARASRDQPPHVVLDPIFEELQQWSAHDTHLWEWERGAYTKGVNRRTDMYRCFAKELAAKYDTLVLEDMDIRGLARRQKLEDGSTDNPGARHYRFLAAPGELRSTLEQAFTRAGRTIRKVDPANTTKTCPSCGYVENFDAAADVVHACGKCGAVRDQDDGAAEMLLVRHREQPPKETAAKDTADEKGGRWARAKKKKTAA